MVRPHFGGGPERAGPVPDLPWGGMLRAGDELHWRRQPARGDVSSFAIEGGASSPVPGLDCQRSVGDSTASKAVQSVMARTASGKATPDLSAIGRVALRCESRGDFVVKSVGIRDRVIS